MWIMASGAGLRMHLVRCQAVGEHEICQTCIAGSRRIWRFLLKSSSLGLCGGSLIVPDHEAFTRVAARATVALIEGVSPGVLT